MVAIRQLIPAAALVMSGAAAPRPRPSIGYTVIFDEARVDIVHVELRLENVPASFTLAMKVHPEYDAKYWRFLDSLRVSGSANDAAANVTRKDSTLWRVEMPGGHGVIRYRLRIQSSPSAARRAWQPFARASGALINPPDFMLYIPDLVSEAATVVLQLPPSWRAATALARVGAGPAFRAPDAATLLDSPILVGRLHEWSFTDAATTFHVVYWPLRNASPFDTAAFVDAIRRLTHEALGIFGHTPSADYYFLIEDGAGDALEHRSSVTIGAESADLARDPRALIPEIAHEFFHSWNLVAIHPDQYGELSFRPAARTTGLWWGEGVTMHYADVLPRRAGIAEASRSRLDHLAERLEAYYGASWTGRVSPEGASMAFGQSPTANPNATGAYYVQGELLAEEIDALVRDSTHEARGLDDVLKAMFDRSADGRGFTAAELEAVMDSVCGCRLSTVFDTQVRGDSPIDVRPALQRLGWELTVDSAQAADDSGRPLPDLRIGIDFTHPDPPLVLVVSNSASAWYAAGLRTGDELVAMADTTVASFAGLRRILQSLRIGDRVSVVVKQRGRLREVLVPVTGYIRPHVQFVDEPNVTAFQRARRLRWLAGW